MSTTQIRITVPEKLKELIEVLASRYGMGMASYIRHVILAEIKRMENLPIRKPSKSTLRAIREGDREFREGKTKQLPTDPDELKKFFDNL